MSPFAAAVTPPISSAHQLRRRDMLGMTPLSVAAAHRNAAVVRTLIEGGADARVTNTSGETPLHRSLCGSLFRPQRDRTPAPRPGRATRCGRQVQTHANRLRARHPRDTGDGSPREGAPKIRHRCLCLCLCRSCRATQCTLSLSLPLSPPASPPRHATLPTQPTKIKREAKPTKVRRVGGGEVLL